MVKLALPALLLVVADSLGFEILTLLAGLHGTAELGAQTLLATLCSFIFKIPFSMGIAASTQIADLLGRGSVQEAKWVANFALMLAGVVGSLIVFLVLLPGNIIPCLFTKDEDVATLMVSAMPVLAVFTLIDAIAGVITGVLRGMGKQFIGAVIQTVGFYVIGLPCSIVAAFNFGWHLSGLGTGSSPAMLCICVDEGISLYFIDWSRLVE